MGTPARSSDRAPGGAEQNIDRAIHAFLGWLSTHGVASHDPYDLWGTRYGLFARRHYYAKRRLGAPLVAPLVALDTCAPGLGRTFLRKQRYATAEAQLALGFINLYRARGNREHLVRAEALLAGLLELSIPGYHGHCWGYPFDWQNNRGMWARNTPFITATPYCFEAFLAAADETRSDAHLQVAASIATFVAFDLHDSPVSARAAAGSYSPIDKTKVVNASAYRAFVLFEAWRRFGVEHYLQIAERNLCFVLESQREDGSWLYGMDSKAEAFIDHFHTCFVLKNLFKVNRIVGRPDLVAAIERGWSFYRRALFQADDTPRSFAIEPRLQLVQVEVYNLAEAITLSHLLRHTVPGAEALAQRLAERTIRDFQLADGHFVTRVFRGGLRHTKAFLRWPQAQMFLALTNLLAPAPPSQTRPRALRTSEVQP